LAIVFVDAQAGSVGHHHAVAPKVTTARFRSTTVAHVLRTVARAGIRGITGSSLADAIAADAAT
jgi:hypothetical protein